MSFVYEKFHTVVKIDGKEYVPGFPQCRGCEYLLISVSGCSSKTGDCMYPTEQKECMPLYNGAFPTSK